MKDFFYRSLSFLALILLLWSCQEELAGDVDPDLQIQAEKGLVQTSTIKDQLASKVAQNLAASLEDPSVLAFIKEKANEKFDGDYNFLISMNADESLSTESVDFNKRTATFGSIISGAYGFSNRTTEGAESFMDSISRFHPLLQVYVPELSEEVNFDNTGDYLVAYVPSEINNGVIPAFDKDGNVIELSSGEVPSIPVVVVSESERITAIPKNPGASSRILFDCPILADAVFEDTNNTYYNTPDVLNSNNDCAIAGGGGGGSGGGSGSNCERDSRTGKEKFYRFKLDNMDTFRDIKDDWFLGDLEIRVSITMSQQTSSPITINKVFYYDNADLKDCNLLASCNTQWVYESAEVITWDPAIYGNTMQWVWSEYDPGTSTTRSYSFANTFKLTSGQTITNTVNWSRTTTTESQQLGESIVEYCDDIGPTNAFRYDTGRLYFEVQ